ncbi:hypothetical protein GCM10022237_48540 [Nocardioides ginsengisoli]|uniref:Uncharacterized protein n=1 Tax=Nocardioides ginsengisoli TaxID=363868 RepID=A0ABW3W3S5_9ACTN
MSESLRTRAYLLAMEGDLQSNRTEDLALLLDDLVDTIRTAGDDGELIDRWKFVTRFVHAQCIDDCTRINGGPL